MAQDLPRRTFSTQSVRAHTLKQFPAYAKLVEDLESRLAPILATIDNKQVFRLPLIIHILESDGQLMPDASQVQAQLDILNQHFGRYTPPKDGFPTDSVEKYAALGADVGIQFFIPPLVGLLPGINRIRTDRPKWSILNQIQDPKQGGVAPVDPTHLINIWIGKLDGATAGYAQLPGAPTELDGIVIDPAFFGTDKGTATAPYHQGKTLVHLMGTYLGLYELWNEDSPCSDDQVADTPLHSGPNDRIPVQKNYRQICFCPGAPLAMYMNFMDNTDDTWLSLFTPGQKARMRAMLSSEGLRATLGKL